MSEPRPYHVLCIAGMHRSGTSLTASWLQNCGLKIDNGELIEGTVGNERGHFEDADFVKLHARHLRSAVPTSKGWIVHRSFLRDVHLFRKEARIIFNSRQSRQVNWGWKDPRTVLFLRDWESIDKNIRFLLIWRYPNEVISSLIARSLKANQPVFKISAQEAVRCYKHYNKSLIEFYKMFPDKCVLVNLDSIIREPVVFFNYLNERFKLDLKYYDLNQMFDPTSLNRRVLNLTLRTRFSMIGVSRVANEIESYSLKF